MHIVLCLQALIAVLGLAATLDQVSSIDHFNTTLPGSSSRIRRSPHKRHSHLSWFDSDYKHETRLANAGKYLSLRDNHKLLRQEMRSNHNFSDCCPSVLEMSEPGGGRNQDGIYVQLYRDGDYKQRFYEISCHKDVLDKPCRFMDRKLHDHSRCVQKYSYSYALVKDLGGQSKKMFPTFPGAGPGGPTWTLDYIRVRSGCGCVVGPLPTKKKRKTKPHRAEGP